MVLILIHQIYLFYLLISQQDGFTCFFILRDYANEASELCLFLIWYETYVDGDEFFQES